MQLFLYITLPIGLLLFGIYWYTHIIRVATGKRERANALLMLLLFYGPLLALIIPLFMLSGASGGFVALGVVVSVPMSTMLYATAVVKKYDGKVIIAFLAINFAIFGGLMLLA